MWGTANFKEQEKLILISGICESINVSTPPPPPPGDLGCCPFWGGGSVVVDLLFIVTPIVGVCNCSMFCCTLFYVHSIQACNHLDGEERTGCFV